VKIFEELKRRNVHRVAIGYVAAAWLLIQIVETLFPVFGLSDTALRAAVIVLAIGFVPAVILSWIFEWTPDGFRRDSEVTVPVPPARTRRFDAAIIAMLVLAVAYFAVDKFIIDPVRDEERIEAAAIEAVEDALAGQLLDKHANRSVIVLPFLNMSADEEQAYFADGISEELLNLLAKIEELRVISRSTSWTFKGKDIDIAAIREKLNVSHILEGSVRKAGNQVRVTAQLIDARTNRHLWSETFDRTLDDIFAIQDEISAEVVNQLKLKLLAGPPTAEEIDPVAYDLYLQGRHLAHTVRTQEALDDAVKMLSRSVELAPDYVPAIWDLARAIFYSNTGDSRDEAVAKEARIRALVDRMVELAPDSSYANGWLGFFAEQAGDLQASALYRERALEAANDSHLYTQQAIAARFLARLGRYEQAAALALYVVDRDPACLACVETLAMVFRLAGKHREAAQAFEQLLEWHDGLPAEFYWYLGVAWLVAGEPEKALGLFEQGLPGNREMGRLMALHDLGRHDEFEAEFSKLRADPERSPESIARIAAWTGQNDLAFEYLERAIDLQGPELAQQIKFGVDLYEPVTSDPRWRAFFDRYDTVREEDLSSIRFNPKLPQEVAEALARQ
jgi:adenylate cyclase